MKEQNGPRGWHSRGYLPHFDGGEIAQFITFRLFDSVPEKVIHKWQMELRLETAEERQKLLKRQIDRYLDLGHGTCFMKDKKIASLIQHCLLHFDGVRYRLWAWTIMPNHVHVLLTPLSGNELSKIIQSIKSFSATEANKILSRKGRFWHRDYFDRYIRNPAHFEKVVNYIRNNPVKAGLCESPDEWPYLGTPASGRSDS